MKETGLIYPELFNGHVMGFYTTRELGVSLDGLTDRKVYFPSQKHTDTVIELDPHFTPADADAVVTDRFDVIIGVITADCVPVLLFDTQQLVIGVVHAGWRGTAKGILKKTISFMSKRYRSEPQDILVSIGPSIRWCCYEVGQDVFDAVSAETGPGDYHNRSKGRHFIDLASANRFQALSLGVEPDNIEVTEQCTRCLPEVFHSYRRDGSKAGRQGGFISLP